MPKIDLQGLSRETTFKFSGSSGNGGQHINRVATKATLLFSVPDSAVLNDEQKVLISERLKNRLTKEGILRISSQKTRSAQRNKKETIEIFLAIINTALYQEKTRKKKEVSPAAHQKRLADKKKQAQKKQHRQFVASQDF